jgi:predicted metal-dependent phosphoesterase TrpH
MYKVDLHTHSSLSSDGGISAADYRKMLDSGRLDYAAITDHNQINFALKLHKSLGDRIIVGEEIGTGEGEIIGLYMKKKIEPGLGAKKTVQEIRRQKGLVYIPHPFEKVRRGGVQAAVLLGIIDQVDIIEIHNGRAYFSRKSRQALEWAETHNLAVAASSDAHGVIGWGKTYSIITQKPGVQNLAKQLTEADYAKGYVGWLGVLYPTINRLKGKF